MHAYALCDKHKYPRRVWCLPADVEARLTSHGKDPACKWWAPHRRRMRTRQVDGRGEVAELGAGIHSAVGAPCLCARHARNVCRYPFSSTRPAAMCPERCSTPHARLECQAPRRSSSRACRPRQHALTCGNVQTEPAAPARRLRRPRPPGRRSAARRPAAAAAARRAAARRRAGPGRPSRRPRTAGRQPLVRARRAVQRCRLRARARRACCRAMPHIAGSACVHASVNALHQRETSSPREGRRTTGAALCTQHPQPLAWWAAACLHACTQAPVPPAQPPRPPPLFVRRRSRAFPQRARARAYLRPLPAVGEVVPQVVARGRQRARVAPGGDHRALHLPAADHGAQRPPDRPSVPARPSCQSGAAARSSARPRSGGRRSRGAQAAGR